MKVLRPAPDRQGNHRVLHGAVVALTDLNGSSGRDSHRGAATKDVDHLLCDEPFETTHNLGFTAPFLQSPLHRDLSLLVPTQPYDDDAVERALAWRLPLRLRQ